MESYFYLNIIDPKLNNEFNLKRMKDIMRVSSILFVIRVVYNIIQIVLHFTMHFQTNNN